MYFHIIAKGHVSSDMWNIDGDNFGQDNAVVVTFCAVGCMAFDSMNVFTAPFPCGNISGDCRLEGGRHISLRKFLLLSQWPLLL